MNYRLFGLAAKVLPYELQRRFLHGLVGRPQRMPKSAGGLCMMSARANSKLSARKFFCVSSPKEPYPPIYLLKKKLGIGEHMLEQIRSDIARDFRCSWQEITSRCFNPSVGEELLLVYDTDDSFVRYTDAESIAAQWKGARLKETSSNKHRAMLAGDEVIQAVCAFVRD